MIKNKNKYKLDKKVPFHLTHQFLHSDFHSLKKIENKSLFIFGKTARVGYLDKEIYNTPDRSLI